VTIRNLIASLFAATAPPLALVGLFAGCNGPTVPLPTDSGPTSDIDRDGFSIAEGDCDDDDATFYPGANDVVGDKKDQDCDGIDGVDGDDDGQAGQASGGADCNDADDGIYFGAEEIGWDGIDQNCDQIDQYDFLKIGGGRFHTCGLDTQGIIRCWGGDADGQVTSRPLTPGWTDLCSGEKFNCAVNEKGFLACWGSNYGDSGVLTNQISDMPTESDFAQVTCGYDWACALDLQGRATCWGSDDWEQVSTAPTQIDLVSIAAARDHGCAVTRSFEKLVCWGRDDETRDLLESVAALNAIQLDGDDPQFLSVSSGQNHSCAIRKDLGISCFGLDSNGQTEPFTEAGPYSNISLGGDASCGVLEQTTLTCWGANTFSQVSDAPIYSINARYVGMGIDHACALRKDNGEPVCWGRDLEGQTIVPEWN
jgi:alpha-tubulin suppressor-like RCC1 family protein